MEPSCQRDSYEVKLSGPVIIAEEWVELKPETPLRADKDLHMVLLELEPPFKYDFYHDGKGPNKGKGILMPEGDVINPEIEVIDQHGNSFKLVWSGARRTLSPVYTLTSPNQWPRDREYKMVRIRSTRPIKCKAIYWYCESDKDMK